MEMNHFIRVYDDALHPQVCDGLMDLYDNNPDVHILNNNEPGKNYSHMAFTKHSYLNPMLYSKIVSSMGTAIKSYKSEVPETKYWPEEYAYEEIRIKCYKNTGDQLFDTHTDAFNLLSSSRILAFFFYLDDVPVGGETEFTNLGVKINPKKGRLLMFPPHWMYPHRGCPPVSNTKYICSSFIRFNS